jgi:hypothetical protein
MEPADTIFINKKGLDSDQSSLMNSDKSHDRARTKRIVGISVGGFFGAVLIAGLVALIL